MQLDEKSKIIIAAINESFVMLASKGSTTAYHISSGDELSKESMIHYCARHYGELSGTETKIRNGEEIEVEVRKEAGRAWWDWKDNAKRVVRRTVMQPGTETSHDVFNTWDHLKKTMVEPDLSATPEDVMPFLEHLCFISDEDTEGATYFINWLAQLYQTPDIKIPSAIMLYSRHPGTGKSMLHLLLSRIFGDPLVGMIPGRELHSKWLGDIVANKRLVIWNELSRHDKADAYEGFKTFVSERRQVLEGKGVRHRELECFVHSIIATNNADCLPLMDGDRRILVLRCEAKPKPPSYYKAFAEWCEGEGAALVAGFLARWEFPKGWNPASPVPQTKAVRDTQLESRMPLHRFVADLIDERKMPFDRDFGSTRGLLEQLGTAYPESMRSMRANEKALGTALKDLGAVQEVVAFYRKDGGRTTARVWVWRDTDKNNQEAIKKWLEQDN